MPILLQTSPRRGRAVGADDAHVDHAVLHQVAAGIVDDHRVRDAVPGELARGQRRALIARPGLVDPDMDRKAGIVRLVDRRGGRAPVDRRQPAGIAMGQDIEALCARRPALVPQRATIGSPWSPIRG